MEKTEDNYTREVCHWHPKFIKALESWNGILLLNSLSYQEQFQDKALLYLRNCNGYFCLMNVEQQELIYKPDHK